jgi:hypothetical protein
MYYAKKQPYTNLESGYNWSQEKGIRKTPTTLKELSSQYSSQQYSPDERLAMANRFKREKDIGSYISGLDENSELKTTDSGTNKAIGEFEKKQFSALNAPSSMTSSSAPTSISDSYNKMGIGKIGGLGGKMGELEKASLRLGQAAADRRLKEQELENISQENIAKQGFGYQSSLQKQRSEQEMQMQELRDKRERQRRFGM